MSSDSAAGIYQPDPDIAPDAEGDVLPAFARDTYQRIGSGEPVHPDDKGLAYLLEHALVAPAGTIHSGPNHYSQTALELVERQQHHKAQLRLTDALSELQSVPRLLHALRRAGGGSFASSDIELISTDVIVNPRIQAAVASAQQRLLTVQPGGARSAEILNASRMRDVESLRRGVTMRTLYNKSARANTADGIATREWVEDVTALGAQVRTAAFPLIRMVVADDVAFVSDYVDTSSEPVRCWQITHPAMAAFVVEVFQLMWDFSTPWEATHVEEEGTVTTQAQRTILRGLAAGRTIPTIARELSIGESSVKQQLADLRAKLGELLKETHSAKAKPVSTLQAVYWWATSGEHSLR